MRSPIHGSLIGRRIRPLLGAVLVAWSPGPAFPAEGPPDLVIDNFDSGLTYGVYTGRKTTIGAYQGTWARRPSYCLLRKSEIHRRGGSGRGGVLEWKREGGWCGYYSLLQNGDGTPVDATPYNTLSFRVKGARGGEKFEIGLSDDGMQDLEIDAVYGGMVSAFLPGGVTREWQEVKVPLSRWEAWVNLAALGSLVLWFSEEGSGKIYVDDIVLRRDPDVAKAEERNAPRAVRDPNHPRALWVWKFDPVANRRARADLFALSERCAIDTLYQYFGDFDAGDDPAYTAELESFIEECHRRGIRIEALTGNPVWALRPNHPACLAWIRAFLEYSAARPKSQRFDGVSLDVEPYLTGEWNRDRAGTKEQYIDLLRQCRALIDGYGIDFALGAAIPMSYELEEKADGFESRALQYLDYAALMAYYDTPRKIIDGSAFHVELAGRLGKKIWLGVEIQDLVRMKQGNRSNTFWEEGWEEMENVLGVVGKRFEAEPGYAGFAMHCDYAYKVLPRGRNAPLRDRPRPEQSPRFKLSAAPLSRPPVLDGLLDDWSGGSALVLTSRTDVASGRGAWAGPKDFGVVVRSAWDADHLYFAFQVTDDKVLQRRTGADMWEGDHVELWLDADLAGDYTEAANSSDDFQIGLSPGNFDDLPPEVFIWTPYLEEDYRKEIRIAAARTPDGYNLEVAIPQELLLRHLKPPAGEGAVRGRFPPGAWLGMGVDPSDCDDANSPQETLMSSAGDGRVWGDPTTFGFLRLEDHP